jgi:hypothetical protein
MAEFVPRRLSRRHPSLAAVATWQAKAPLVKRGLAKCQSVRYPSSSFIIANQHKSRSRAEDDGVEP